MAKPPTRDNQMNQGERACTHSPQTILPRAQNCVPAAKSSFLSENKKTRTVTETESEDAPFEGAP